MVAIVSITAHEFGHAWIGRTFGLTPSIELHAMGGTTSYSEARSLAAWQHMAISLAGPVAGFALGGLVLVIAPLFPPVRFLEITRADLLWINFGWGALNLLPVLPLDGGHVAERLTSTRAARVISIVTAGALAIGAFVWHSESVAFLLVILAFMNFGQGRKQTPRRFEAGWTALDALDFAEAERVAREGLASAPPTDMDARKEAAELLAWSLFKASRFEDAVRALDEFPSAAPADPWLRGLTLVYAKRPGDAVEPLRTAFETRPDSETGMFLVQALLATGRLDDAMTLVTRDAGALDSRTLVVVEATLFHADRFDDAAVVGALAFRSTGTPIHAYNTACSHARAARTGEALEWLDRAASAGYANVADLDADADLASLRSHERYAAIRSRIVTAESAGMMRP